jgi:hypothetical protein
VIVVSLRPVRGQAIALATRSGEATTSLTQRATITTIDHVTAEDVAAVSRRWIRPDHAPMVIIGAWTWMISHPVRVPGGVGIMGL